MVHFSTSELAGKTLAARCFGGGGRKHSLVKASASGRGRGRKVMSRPRGVFFVCGNVPSSGYCAGMGLENGEREETSIEDMETHPFRRVAGVKTRLLTLSTGN